MKRFYTVVSAAPVEDGYAIHLDRKPVRVPSGGVLTLPSAVLADAIVAEWAAQADTVRPDTMPLTQIATTVQDRVRPMRAEVEGQTLAYLDTDLLCYRADRPDDLVRAQAEAWDPGLAWFADRHGARLALTNGLRALRQPDAAHESVAGFVRALDDHRLAALNLVTTATGSLVLALAFVERRLDGARAFAAAQVDDDYKARIYLEDVYGQAPHQEQRNSALIADLEALDKYLDALPHDDCCDAKK